MRARVSGGGKVRVAVGSWLGSCLGGIAKSKYWVVGWSHIKGYSTLDGVMQGTLRHGDVRGGVLRFEKARLGQLGHGCVNMPRTATSSRPTDFNDVS